MSIVVHRFGMPWVPRAQSERGRVHKKEVILCELCLLEVDHINNFGQILSESIILFRQLRGRWARRLFFLGTSAATVLLVPIESTQALEEFGIHSEHVEMRVCAEVVDPNSVSAGS